MEIVTKFETKIELKTNPKIAYDLKSLQAISYDVRIQKNVVHSGKIQTMVERRMGKYFSISLNGINYRYDRNFKSIDKQLSIWYVSEYAEEFLQNLLLC